MMIKGLLRMFIVDRKRIVIERSPEIMERKCMGEKIKDIQRKSSNYRRERDKYK